MISITVCATGIAVRVVVGIGVGVGVGIRIRICIGVSSELTSNASAINALTIYTRIEPFVATTEATRSNFRDTFVPPGIAEEVASAAAIRAEWSIGVRIENFCVTIRKPVAILEVVWLHLSIEAASLKRVLDLINFPAF